jgi:hypothetical protein
LHQTFARLEVAVNCFMLGKNLHLRGSWSDPILPLATECPDSWLVHLKCTPPPPHTHI